MKFFLDEEGGQQNIQAQESLLEKIIDYISNFKEYFDLIKFVFIGILFLIAIIVL